MKRLRVGAIVTLLMQLAVGLAHPGLEPLLRGEALGPYTVTALGEAHRGESADRLILVFELSEGRAPAAAGTRLTVTVHDRGHPIYQGEATPTGSDSRDGRTLYRRYALEVPIGGSGRYAITLTARGKAGSGDILFGIHATSPAAERGPPLGEWLPSLLLIALGVVALLYIFPPQRPRIRHKELNA